LANIPFALGWIVGNMVSGPLYDAFANKLIITRQYLLEVKRVPLDTLKDIVEKYKGSNPDKLLPETIEKMNIETFNFFPYFQQIMGVDQYEANHILWEAYHPWRIWVILSTFGFITIISMLAYSFNKRKNR
nr:hypothetical protein [bacterium]